MKTNSKISAKTIIVIAAIIAAVCCVLVFALSKGDQMDKNIIKARKGAAEASYTSSSCEALGEQIDKLAENAQYQGVILVARNEEILYAGAFGDADSSGTKNTIDTVFGVGSLTKQFTASAILKLASEGKLMLSDPLSKYFPDYQYGAKITVQHLLNMDSGVNRDFWTMAYSLYHYTTMAQADEFQMSPHSETELMQLIYDSPLEFEPGTQYMYSNVNYFLLSRIVQQASGISYQDYIKENFFAPCNMDSAFMDFEGEMAQGNDADGPTRENAILYEGAGTVCCSVLDMYRWNLMLHGGKVLPDSAYRVMTTPAIGNYAAGLLVESDGMIWHNGELNGYNSYNAYYPDSGLMVILLANNRTYKFHSATVDFPAEGLGPIVMRYAKEAIS